MTCLKRGPGNGKRGPLEVVKRFTLWGRIAWIETSVLSELEEIINKQDRKSLHELWVIFLGHGQYDGRKGKFNLVGPDLAADQQGLVKRF